MQWQNAGTAQGHLGMAAVTEYQLAWELAESLNSRLSAEERALVFMDLGSDDFLGAINRLLHIALSHQEAVSPTARERLHMWMKTGNRYRDHGVR